MIFPRDLARSYMQIASSRIWIRVIDFISYDDNRNAKRAPRAERNRYFYRISLRSWNDNLSAI